MEEIERKVGKEEGGLGVVVKGIWPNRAAVAVGGACWNAEREEGEWDRVPIGESRDP